MDIYKEIFQVIKSTAVFKVLHFLVVVFREICESKILHNKQSNIFLRKITFLFIPNF